MFRQLYVGEFGVDVVAVAGGGVAADAVVLHCVRGGGRRRGSHGLEVEGGKCAGDLRFSLFGDRATREDDLVEGAIETLADEVGHHVPRKDGHFIADVGFQARDCHPGLVAIMFQADIGISSSAAGAAGAVGAMAPAEKVIFSKVRFKVLLLKLAIWAPGSSCTSWPTDTFITGAATQVFWPSCTGPQERS